MDKQKRELSKCLRVMVLVFTEDFILKLFAPILVTGNVEPLTRSGTTKVFLRTLLLSILFPFGPRTLSSPSNLEINLINK